MSSLPMDVTKDGTEEKRYVLKFTKLQDHLCNKAYSTVAKILIFGLESFEENGLAIDG